MENVVNLGMQSFWLLEYDMYLSPRSDGKLWSVVVASNFYCFC